MVTGQGTRRGMGPGAAVAMFFMVAMWGALATRFGLPTPDDVTTGITCQRLENGKWVQTSCRKNADPGANKAPEAPVEVPASDCGVVGEDAVLRTIRELESGGNYGAVAPGENAAVAASGAYQFVKGTWAGYGGYARAVDAPPAVQDDKARRHVAEALGGTTDVSRVPVVWYIGHVPVGEEWDVVPAPWAGNRLTPRQYQQRWMAIYQRMGAACGVPA